MTDYSVSISVVTYNSGQHIGALLDSIIQFVHDVDYHIYVVDNGSTDGTVGIVKSKAGPVISLLQSPKNMGFGGGHNLVLKQIHSKYHICVNPDILINDDVVSRMASYMDENDDIGILTPKILNPDGSVQILPKRNPKLIYLVARRIGLRVLQKYRNEYEMLDRGADQKYDIEFSSGCFMFIRTELLKQLDGFDERFFMYFEDADLTRSIRRFKRAEYNPAFVVYHVWERAGGKKIKFFLIQVISMLKYINKWRNDDQCYIA